MDYTCYPDRPEKLTAEFLEEEYRKLIERIDEAERSETSDEWMKLFGDWNDLSIYTSSDGSRKYFSLAGNMAEPEAVEAERRFREELAPVIDRHDIVLRQALAESRHRQAFIDRYGAQLLRRIEIDLEPLAPVNLELRVKERELCNRYEQFLALATIEFDGQEQTLMELGSMMQSEDRELRRRILMASNEWLLANRDWFVDLFDELLACRQQMARNLGDEDFIRLGYLRMGRMEYGPEEAAQLYENVRRYALPLRQRLVERHARRLGLERLRPYDAAYDPESTLPRGIIQVDRLLASAQRLFDSLSPRLGEHFARMRRQGLIDLEHRPGKVPGAFCTTFSDRRQVAIMCNSIGDADDLSMLLHEMGHAFQNWESQWIVPLDIQSPTFDLCEVHSIGMEFLSLRHIDEFLPRDEAEKFRRNRWQAAVDGLCGNARIDEFQHWVYRNPAATADEREQMYVEIGDRYSAGIDWSGLEHYRRLWYDDVPIFARPFYIIDYMIAELGAMQLALIDAEDHERAMEMYMELCRIGGTKGVLEAFESCGFRSPFDPELMKDLMDRAARELGVEA